MAAGEHGAEVQAYLDKHRITKLFEDLLSKVVKELPASPVDFLISKLQVIKQRKKTAPPAVSGKSKLRISGSSVSPRPKSSTSVPTKPSSLRPPGTKTSSLSPSKPSPSQSPRPASSSIPKPGSRSGLRTPGSKVKTSVTTPTRPTTAPPNKSTPKSSAIVRSKLPTSQLKTPSTRSGPTKVTSTTPKGKSKVSAATEGKKPVSESAKEPVTVDVKPVIEENTFSSDPLFDEDDEELAELKGKDVREWSEEREEEEEKERTGDMTDDFILDDIIKLRKSSTHSKHTYIQSLLAPPTGSEGYGSEDDDSEKDGELEMVEDYEALEEEGWIGTGSKKSKFSIKKALPPDDQATVDLQLRICSRCARVLTEGGEGEISTAETVSMVTQVTSGEADFESASQVGSHTSFPQWTGSAVSNPPLQQSSDSEVSSDVTLQSHDTWGGIAPEPRANLPPSDAESEVQLPPPVPLEGLPWSAEGTTTHTDHYGWA